MDVSDMLADRSAYDLSREPEILPRVGDEFQAEIPELVSRSEYLLLPRNGEDGLSVPVLLSSRNHGSTKRRKARAPNRSRTGIIDESVPLSEPDCWTNVEKGSFLVGLYIFQKNFVLLAEFMETRSMGHIMAYYYGRFYRSKEYCRWSDTRGMGGRRCVFGHKMFTGARQRELLARLFSNASENCQILLAEVSRSFSDGNIPLSEYVSSMKGLVGLRRLVKAVGIGKGKQDLTSVRFEPSEASRSIQMQPDDAPTQSRRHYLQPGMRCTIVSSDGEKAHRLMELKIPKEFSKPYPRNLVQLADEDAPKAAEVKIEPTRDQQSQQRRGTRNRTPTARALEALANDLL